MNAQKWANIKPLLEPIIADYVELQDRCVQPDFDLDGNYNGCLKFKDVEVDIIWRDENDPLKNTINADEVWIDPDGGDIMLFLSGWEEQYRIDYAAQQQQPKANK